MGWVVGWGNGEVVGGWGENRAREAGWGGVVAPRGLGEVNPKADLPVVLVFSLPSGFIKGSILILILENVNHICSSS